MEEYVGISIDCVIIVAILTGFAIWAIYQYSSLLTYLETAYNEYDKLEKKFIELKKSKRCSE